MLLDDKRAVVHGAGGAIGGAVARRFAAEGATVFVAGRTRAPVEAVAEEITAAGGEAYPALVDALDGRAVDAHAAAVVEQVGGIDVAFNAIGLPQPGIQGTPLLELSPERFALPVETYARSQFLTARAAGRHMVDQRSGVILTLTATPARIAAPLVGGMGPAWAAVEALTRGLAAELGPRGVRVLCLRPDAIPETATIATVFGQHAKALGIDREAFEAMMTGLTLRRRLPSLAEVADVAAFLASDRAAALTGTVANLSGGSVTD